MDNFLTDAQRKADETALKTDEELSAKYEDKLLTLVEYLTKLEAAMTTLATAGSINARDYCKVITRILEQVRSGTINEGEASDWLCDWSQVLYR